ncbi:unnamed protein product [Rhizophagus irregularis]|nr:unnamed protein product [Rhizophagus irregularis]
MVNLVQQLYEEINAYLLGQPIDDEEELFEYRPDWIFLTEMGQKPNFDCSSDLGLAITSSEGERVVPIAPIRRTVPGIVNLELLANSSSSCVGNYGA